MNLAELLNTIESLHKELTALEPLSIERQEKINRKFRLEFNYNSNHIEGNTLTYGETVLYLIFDKTTGEHNGREYEEMKASDLALKLVQELAADKERPLTEAFIKNLHKIILVRPYWANAITPDGQQTRRVIEVGDYKKQPNSVRLQNGEIFNYASPEETPSLMSELLGWYRGEAEKKELHPVALAALLHYRFVRIHPFDDGNGRMSRLLMNYVCYYNGLPPVIIKSANKKEYLSALNKADTGDIESFVAYIAEQMIWPLELSIKAAKGEEIEEQDDIEKEVAVFKKKLHEKSEVTVVSQSIINQLYIKSFARLFKTFDAKISSLFEDLFTGWHSVGMINRNSEFPVGFSFESFIHPLLNIKSLLLNIDSSGFKKNYKDDIALNIKLEILFYGDGYQVKVFTPLGIKSYFENGKKYEQLITKDEQQTIISDAVKSILTYIKEHSEVQI